MFESSTVREYCKCFQSTVINERVALALPMGTKRKHLLTTVSLLNETQQRHADKSAVKRVTSASEEKIITFCQKALVKRISISMRSLVSLLHILLRKCSRERHQANLREGSLPNSNN